MSTDPALPEQIGRYPVTRLIGCGAMGCVYLARDTELDRDVAIKTVRVPESSSSERKAYLERFRNEARAVGRLRHRSIVAVYDVGSDAALGPFLVFEYIKGRNLKQVVRAEGPLSPEQVIALAEQVGAALEVAHREGIIHRDIKPENLLIGEDGLVKLADFGVARVPDATLTGAGQFLGTPCYGAPETLRGGEASPLSDQFALAAVLYEAATGARAFPGQDAVSVAHQVIHDEPLAPSKAAQPGAVVPAALDPVLLRALSKRPEQRYPQISLLVAALYQAYAEAGVLSTLGTDETLPATLAHLRPRPASSRSPLKLWPFAAILLVGFVAVVKLAPSVSSGPEPVPTAEATSLTPAALDAGAQVGVEAPPLVDAAPPLPQDGSSESVDGASDGSSTFDTANLSAFEREERAKDALERAQRALLAGERESALRALEEAERYDPEHPDISELRRRL